MGGEKLRRRAEQIITEQPGKIHEISAEDMRDLIHELQVHQVELEMQNEELRKAHLELEASRKKYYELYDFAPVGYFTLNENGIILEANLAAAELLGTERRYVTGSGLSRFLAPESQDRFYYYRKRAQETGLNQNCEIKFILRDGTGIHAQLQVMGIRDDEDETTHFHVTVTDITDRRRMEDELRKSHECLEQHVEERTEELREAEAKYRELVQNANSIIYRRDSQGHITFFNEYAQTFFGYSETEILGKHVVGTIVPERDRNGRDLALMIADINRNPDRYVTNSNENMRRNGERVWISWTNKAIRDEDGHVREFLCVGNDITTLRETEEALKKSEEQYRALVENIGIGISLISPEMRILALNRQMRTWFPNVDVTTSPFCYRSFNDPPRDEICSFCPTHLALRDGKVHEAVTETPAGDTLRNYRIVVSPIKDECGIVTAAIEMVEDITENLELQNRLALSEKLYETVFETTATATVIIEDDMTILLANREFEHISGYRKEEIEREKKWTEFVAAADRERMEGYHRMRRVDSGAVPRTYTFTFIDGVGNEKVILNTVQVIPGTKRAVASMLDITEQHRLQMELQESEARYRMLADNISDVIWAADLDLHFNYISPSVEKLLGYTAEDVEARLMDNILTLESRTVVLELAEKFRKALQYSNGKEHTTAPKTVELDLIRRDGTHIWTETTATIMDDGAGATDTFVGVTRDITERRQADQERWESEHRYHLIFDSSPTGIFFYDTQLCLIDCNDQFESYSRVSREKLIKFDLYTINDQRVLQTLRESLEGRISVYEGMYTMKISDTDMWINLKAAPVLGVDGSIIGGVAIIENISERVIAQQALETSKADVEAKSRYLEETNTALKVILNRIEEDKTEIEENMLFNIRELVIPFIEKVKMNPSKSERDACIQVLEANLNNIASPFLRNMSLKHYNLTPKELQVANLVKEGKLTKEIAGLLYISERSVEFHRSNIREKLNIKNKKANLRSILLSMS